MNFYEEFQVDFPSETLASCTEGTVGTSWSLAGSGCGSYRGRWPLRLQTEFLSHEDREELELPGQGLPPGLPCSPPWRGRCVSGRGPRPTGRGSGSACVACAGLSPGPAPPFLGGGGCPPLKPCLGAGSRAEQLGCLLTQTFLAGEEAPMSAFHT